MEQISTLLQGGYAYLLIFQIVVVSALFLLLVTMVLRRMKTEVAHFSGVVAATEGASHSATTEDSGEWKAKFLALEEDFLKSKAGKDDHDALVEKVKFLEGKLLEYEILQEEIGSLSNLKTENEKLKTELSEIQASVNQTPVEAGSAPPPPVEPIVAVSTPPPPPPEPSPEPVVVAAPAASAAPTAPQDDAMNLDGLLKEIDALAGQDGTPKAS